MRMARGCRDGLWTLLGLFAVAAPSAHAARLNPLLLASATVVPAWGFNNWKAAFKTDDFRESGELLNKMQVRLDINASGWVAELYNISNLLDITEYEIVHEEELVADIVEGSETTSQVSSVFWYVELQVGVYFVSLAAFFSLMVKTGYTLRFAGLVRAKNVLGTMFLHFFDVAVGVLVWWITGYGVAFGADSYPKEAENGIAGSDMFVNALPNSLGRWNSADGVMWIFFFGLMMQSFTIFSGAIMERQHIHTHLLLTLAFCGVAWPIICHTLWSEEGLFSSNRSHENLAYGCGVLDYLGSGGVHVAASVFSMPIQFFLGPRLKRWNKQQKMIPMVLNSPVNVLLGTYMVVFFTAGISIFPHDAHAYVAQANLAAGINVIFAALSGAVSAMVFGSLKDGIGEWLWSVEMIGSGMLAGLAAISAGAPFFEQVVAVWVGGAAGFLYVLFGVIQNQLMIDDTATVIPIHFIGGLWGMIAVGLFTEPEAYHNYFKDEFSDEALSYRKHHCAGLLYPTKDTTWPIHQMSAQLVFVIFESLLLLFISFSGCAILNEVFGLRLPPDIEEDGVDRHFYGGLIESVPPRLNMALHARKWTDLPSPTEIREAQVQSRKCERLHEILRVIAKKNMGGQKLSVREKDLQSKYAVLDGLVFVKMGKHLFQDPVYDDTECTDHLLIENPAGVIFIPSDCPEMQEHILAAHVELYPIGVGVHNVTSHVYSSCEDVLRKRFFWPGLFMHDEIRIRIEEIENARQAQKTVDKYVSYGGAFDEDA